MSKIALAMIVKGVEKDVQRLDNALASVAEYVDGIYITISSSEKDAEGVLEVCRKYNANVSFNSGEWEADKKTVDWLTKYFGYKPNMKVGQKLFLFDEARNFNFSQVPKDYEWILWIDCDDVVRNGQNIRKVVDDADKNNFEAIYFKYVYQAEIDNKEGVPLHKQEIRQIIIEHLRERLIRNNGKYKWIAPIHETLIEQTPTSKTDNYDVEILHLTDNQDRLSSLTRNLANLELAIARTEGKDPRHLYYLAKAYFDIRTTETDDKLIPLIMSYLEGEHKSGWPQERSQAYEYLAEVYRRRGQHNNAIKALMNALIEEPKNPSIFINLAITYAAKQNWELALFWVNIAGAVPEQKTTLVKSPRDIAAMTLEVLYNACLNMGKIDEAYNAAMQMKQLVPNEPQVDQALAFITQLKEQRDVTKTVVRLAEYLKSTGEWHKVKPLLAATPRIAENTPFIIELNKKNNPPKIWRDKEIAIFCGPGFTTWSPRLMDDPQGSFVGGSEEAVIKMSQALNNMGWKVTVYGDPGDDEGDIDGVNWLPYYKFNLNDRFNIIIAWRNPKFFEQNIEAKKRYVWCHDIQNPLDYSDKAIENTTKFMFLSKWHRDNVPKLSEDKIWITSNGI